MKKTTIAFPFICLVLTATSHAVTLALIDFGDSGTQTVSETLSGTERFWNNVTTVNQPTASALSLTNPANSPSGISLQVSRELTGTGFGGFNTAGLNPSAGEAALRFFPTSATRDSLYSYTTATGGFTSPTGVLTLVFSGLTTGVPYDFHGLASRSATNGREGVYTFTGLNSGNVTSDASPATGANSEVFSVTGILPDVNNRITMTMAVGPNNNTAEKFFYLNALEIATVPEPSSALAGVLGLGLLALRRRR